MKKGETGGGKAVEGQGSKVEGQAKGGNCGKGEEVGLVELVPPMGKGRRAADDRRQEGLAAGDAPYQSDRAQLVGVLEEFGISPGTFDGLRSDCYEKHIAARSVAELKSVYLTLLRPIEGSAEMQRQFPRWSAGHPRHGGKLPSINTLMGIKNRMMAEQTANEVGNLMQQVQMIHNQTAKLPGDLQGQVYNAMLAVIGQELFKAKFEGKPMSQNLAVVDRLMKAAVIRYRERQGDKRNEQRDRAHKIQEGRLALARKKQRRSMIDRQRDAGPQLSEKAEVDVQVPQPAVPRETPEEVMMRIYGGLPGGSNPPKPEAKMVEGRADDRQQSRVEGQAEAEVNYKDTEAQSTKFQNPESKLQGNSNNQAPMAEQTVKESGNKTVSNEIAKTVESPGDDCQQSKVEGKAAENAAAKVDTRPEWAKKPGNYLIGAPCKWHPMGIKKYKNKPVDAATQAVIRDMNWETFIGFGGDGEKVLN